MVSSTEGGADEDRLEPPLEGGVLLDVLAVLVEGGGPDEAELAAGQHRLDHVAGVHRPLGRAGADDGVELVDEGDDLALGVGDLLQDRLQPLLELAPVLGPGDHRPTGRGDRPACPCRPSGTSPSTIRLARPSTMAVLPTPGSPMSTGLFLVRRDSTWMTRRISSSRPMTGSSLPWRASSVRSRPYFSSAWYGSSGFWRGDPVAAPDVAQRRRAGRPARRPRSSASASRRCSTERYSSPMSPLSASARLERLARGARSMVGLGAAEGLGQPGQLLAERLRTAGGLDARPGRGSGRRCRPSWPRTAASRWSGVHLGVVAASRARLDGAGEGLLGLEGPAVRVECSSVLASVVRAARSACRSRVGRTGQLVDSGTRSRRYWRWVRSTASRASARARSSSRSEPGDLGLELEDPADALEVEPARR